MRRRSQRSSAQGLHIAPQPDHEALGLGTHGSFVNGTVPFLVYVRCSGLEQDTSVEQQIEVAEMDLVALGRLPVGAKLPRNHAPASGVFADDGVSAWKVPPSERPGSAALLAHMRANARPIDRPGLLWVWAQSRMLRAEYGGAEAVAQLLEFARWGWTIYSHEQRRRLDVMGPDALLGTITVALHGEKDAAHSREKASAVRRAKLRQVHQGVWLGGFAPPGYDRWAATVSKDVDPETGRRGVLEWIEPLPLGKRNGLPHTVTLLRTSEDAERMRELFRLVAEGEGGRAISITDVQRRLHDGLLPCLDGRRRWSRSSVNSLLVNEVYIGVQRDADDQPHQALWEPLIDRSIWDRVQQRLASNAAQRRGVNTDFVLSGLLFCGACAARYGGERQTTPKGVQMDYYRANTFLKVADPGRCAECRARVRADVVETEVLAAVRRIAQHPAVLQAIAAETEARARGHAGSAARSDAIKHDATEIRRQIDNLLPHLAIGGAVAAQVQERLRELNEAAREAERALAALSADRGRPAVAQFAATAGDFPRVWEHAGPAERKDLIRCFVARIEIEPTHRVLRIGIRHPPNPA